LTSNAAQIIWCSIFILFFPPNEGCLLWLLLVAARYCCCHANWTHVLHIKQPSIVSTNAMIEFLAPGQASMALNPTHQLFLAIKTRMCCMGRAWLIGVQRQAAAATADQQH